MFHHERKLGYDFGAEIVFPHRALRIRSKLLGNHPIKSYFQLRSFKDIAESA